MARKSPGGGKPHQPKGDELFWLETYFIMFPHQRRPTLSQVEHALAAADPRLQIDNLAADDDGLFQSLLVQSPEDHAAVEISYETGDAVIEQNLEWAKQLQKQLPAKQLQQLITSDARLDVAHFERIQAEALRPQPNAPGAAPRKSRSEFDEEDSFASDQLGDDPQGDDSPDDDFDEEAALEIFDPTCLLTVVETLSALTRGLAFDPAAGEVVQAMLAKDLKPGAIIKHNDAPLAIESVTVQSPSARGGSTLYKFRARNLVTKQKTDLSCKGTDNFHEADFEKRAVTLMYADQDHVHLLDQQDYNQYAMPVADVAGELPFITEGLEGMLALIYNGECVGLQLPAAVALKIVECDPAVKGNSATSRTKPAKLETGLVIAVPEYFKQDETVKVDTRSGEFLSRA